MSKIEDIVQSILEKCKIARPPIDVYSIARNASIEISDGDFDNTDNISGMLYRDDEHTAIAINPNHHPNRQRFSIAHELGHYYLHTGGLFVDRVDRVNATRHFRNEISSLAIDRKEIEANTFAANLLMPKSFIISEINNILEERENISAEDLIGILSDIFSVSGTAMAYRLENLGILVSQD